MTVFNVIVLIFREQDFLKGQAFLLTRPVHLEQVSLISLGIHCSQRVCNNALKGIFLDFVTLCKFKL